MQNNDDLLNFSTFNPANEIIRNSQSFHEDFDISMINMLTNSAPNPKSPLNYQISSERNVKNFEKPNLSPNKAKYNAKIDDVSNTLKEIDELLGKIEPIKRHYETKKSMNKENSSQSSVSTSNLTNLSAKKEINEENEKDAYNFKEKNLILSKILKKIENCIEWVKERPIGKLLMKICRLLGNIKANDWNFSEIQNDINRIDNILEDYYVLDPELQWKTEFLLINRGLFICKEKILQKQTEKFIEKQFLTRIESISMLEEYDLELI